MTVAYVYPSGGNTFIPTFDEGAQGSLIVEYSRAPDKFHLNKYTQLQQVTLEAGKYWRFDQNAMARVNTGDGSQFVWADGADRPAQNIWQGFDMPAYSCVRRNFGFNLGDLATYHAQKAGGVDLVAVNSKTAAAAAMLQRTRIALTVAQDLTQMQWYNANSSYNTALNQTAYGIPTGANTPTAGSCGNWSGQYVGAAASGLTPAIGLTQGNYWDKGYIGNSSATTAGPNTGTYLRSGVNTIAALIDQQTNGMVLASEMLMVMGVDTAIALGQSAEITDYVKQSIFAMPHITQTDQFSKYGIPDMLFGIKTIVENASYISAHPFGSNTPTRAWVLPFGTIVFLSRPGGIEGTMYSFSTLMGFFFEEMTVETFDKAEHRYTQGNVVDNYSYVITSPISGFVAMHVVSGS